MSRPLENVTVALAEGRQLADLAGLLENEGAVILRCPLLNILDAPDTAAVESWLLDLIASRFDWVVLMTGEAVHRLLGFAERMGRKDDFVRALGAAKTISRGPKPVKALKEIGLTATKTASAPTTEGVIATLKQEDLKGLTVGVTLFGSDNPALESFLRSVGAQVRPVLSYVFAPAADDERVADLIGRLEQGKVGVVVFTSSPQVDRLFEVAKKRGLEENLARGWSKTRVAAVGPLVADALKQHQAPVHICPEQGWVMKNLVRMIARNLGG
jgi:uroporphyrinogen-III synthase